MNKDHIELVQEHHLTNKQWEIINNNKKIATTTKNPGEGLDLMPEVYNILHKTSAKKDETAVYIQGGKKGSQQENVPERTLMLNLVKKALIQLLKICYNNYKVY